jgi:hypothetical protein
MDGESKKYVSPHFGPLAGLFCLQYLSMQGIIHVVRFRSIPCIKPLSRKVRATGLPPVHESKN